MAAPAAGSSSRPSFWRDRSFQGVLATQFLGAMNDNFFKQAILLFCTDMALKNRADDLQGLAQGVFAVPFILFSGLCGALSDRVSKRTIIVLSKVLEIVVMLLGMAAFASGQVTFLMAVLFCMGAQSALFGPSKYGVLPELFHEVDLPRINGAVLMTTFLSIILGFAAAGEVLTQAGNQIWIAGAIAVGIAGVGTLTSLMIRRTPVAQPDLPFHISSLWVREDTWRLLKAQPALLRALLASSAFWMASGVVLPAINAFGRAQLQLTKAGTGRLAACTGIGIMLGCGIGGWLSRGRFDGRLVRVGALGMLVLLILLGLPGGEVSLSREADAAPTTLPTEAVRPAESSALTVRQPLLGLWGSALAFVGLGAAAGLFSVPVQVYLQAKTPAEHKGRVIGAMNLANWIGIALSAVYYQIGNLVLHELNIPQNGMFAATALIMLPVVLFYRPRSEALSA